MVSKRELPAHSTTKAVKPAVAPPGVKSPLSLKRNPTTPQEMLALQRTAGNQAVLRRIQAKLQVGAADDGYEREAERTATSVMTNIHRLTQRDRQSSEPTAAVQPQDATVQREAEDEEALQPFRNVGDHRTGFEVGGDVEAALAQEQGRGTPLAPAVQRRMEAGFGADLSDVRVHTDSAADSLNQSVHAQAFTYGKDIYFSEGSYKPGTPAGDHLLAHELTHVGQQTGVRRIARKAAIQRLFGRSKFNRTSEVTSKKYVDISSSGAVGVFFLSDHAPDHQGKKGNTVVVKFEPGEVSPALFAESTLSGLGMATANSQATPSSSRAGKRIRQWVGKLIGQGNYPINKMQQIVAKYNNGASAGAVIVGDFVQGTTMIDMLQNTGGVGHNRMDMATALMDPRVAFDLGRLSIFDIMLGNGDRIKPDINAMSNVGNFMFLPVGGGRWRVVAIDNNTDAPTMDGRAEQLLDEHVQTHLTAIPLDQFEASLTGKVDRAVQVKARQQNMFDKVAKGGDNKWANPSAPVSGLMDDPDTFAAAITKNLRTGVEKEMQATTSNVDQQARTTLKWGVIEANISHGVHAAVQQVLKVTDKSLQKQYSNTRSQSGSMSNEVSVAFMKLKIHAISLWAQGKNQGEIRSALSEEVKRLYGNSEGMYKGTVRLDQDLNYTKV